MQPTTQITLLDLNRQFYQTFGPAFALTRRRIQPGVRAVLARIGRDLPAGRWLDVGCGSGALAQEWAAAGKSGLYFGVDFSAALLDEARAALSGLSLPAGLEIRFEPSDLADPHWTDALSAEPFDGALAFASLHHLPGADLRLRVLRDLRAHLRPGGIFVHSEWQFQHSPKLMARRHEWSEIGLQEDELEPGDTLLDWKFALPGQAEQVGLRYVHLFERAELDELAGQTGFRVLESFESDGEGGRLGLYQIWQAVD